MSRLAHGVPLYAPAIFPATARRRRQRAIVCACLVGSLVMLGPSVPSATAQALASGGTFSISPSRRDLAGAPPATLMPTKVSDTTSAAYDVRVFPVLLRQDVSGAFQFDETPMALGAARMILSVSPSQFQLAAGAAREVTLRWNLLPLAARAAYVGIVFQGQPRLKGGRSVPVISRLLSINFLRLPGQYHPNGAFTALHVIQFAPRALRVLPRVRNTGNIVDLPQHGRLSITDTSGRTVYKTSWTGDVILPGAVRDFPIDVQQTLPAGTYAAHAVMSFGATRRAVTSTAFTLAGPNRLTAPDLKITGFAAQGQVGGPAHVSGTVQSTGTTPANLALTLSLFRVTGGLPEAQPLATSRLSLSALPPGSARPLDVDLRGHLTGGSYHVVAQYTSPAGTPQQITSDFAASVHQSLFERGRLFVDRHRSLIILAVVLIAAAGLAARLLRRQRRLEAELRQVKAEHHHGDPPAA